MGRSVEWWLVASGYIIAAFAIFAAAISFRSGKPRCGICGKRLTKEPNVNRWMCKKCRVGISLMRIL